MSDAQIVHEFEAGRQTIRAAVSHFRGEVYVDLRSWYEPEPGQELRPTKKGLRLSAEYLEELREAIELLKVAAVQAGGSRRGRRATVP